MEIQMQIIKYKFICLLPSSFNLDFIDQRALHYFIKSNQISIFYIALSKIRLSLKRFTI